MIKEMSQTISIANSDDSIFPYKILLYFRLMICEVCAEYQTELRIIMLADCLKNRPLHTNKTMPLKTTVILLIITTR